MFQLKCGGGIHNKEEKSVTNVIYETRENNFELRANSVLFILSPFHMKPGVSSIKIKIIIEMQHPVVVLTFYFFSDKIAENNKVISIK